MAESRKFAGTDILGGSTPKVVAHESARSGWLTYETFYGLREKPFGLSSDPRFFYQSPSHAAAFEDLLAGIRRRESLSVLSGDIGTGKTTLCRAALHCLDRETFSAFVPDPFVSRKDLLKVVLMEFGVISVDDLTSGRLGGASRAELSHLLYAFLGKLAPLQAFAVVFIDEAQNLPLSLLEEIRILSDSDGRQRQLQIVLVGQLELQHKLTLPEMRQVEQRVQVRCRLEPLTREGMTGYIARRLQVAGASPDRIAFSEDALHILHRISGGVPRIINRICDRALHHGHLKRTSHIDCSIVETAASELGSAPVGSDESRASSRPLPPPRPNEVPVKQPEPDPSHEAVEHWLSNVDANVAKISAVPQRGDLLLTTASNGALLTATTDATINSRTAARETPRTFLERKLRRGVRLIGGAAAKATAVGPIVLAAAILWNTQSKRDETAAPIALPAFPALTVGEALKPPALPEDPSLSPRPAAGRFIIEVALFQGEAQGDRAVQELTGTGFPAYRAPINLGAKGLRQQILAGPYATLAEAELHLARLHRTTGYADARVRMP